MEADWSPAMHCEPTRPHDDRPCHEPGSAKRRAVVINKQTHESRRILRDLIVLPNKELSEVLHNLYSVFYRTDALPVAQPTASEH